MSGPKDDPTAVAMIVNDKATAISLDRMPGKRNGTVISMGKKAQERPLIKDRNIKAGIEPVKSMATYVPAMRTPKTIRNDFSLDLRAAA